MTTVGSFHQRAARIPALFQAMMASELGPWNVSLPQKPGVYVFVENDVPIHVGRTKNLRNRVRSHARPSHNSASFAFKMARNQLGYKASYQKEGSRSDLEKRPEFKLEFERQRKRIKNCSIRYLVVEDPIDHLLLELYAAIEYGLPLDEFATH